MKRASEKKRKYYRDHGKNETWKRIERETDILVKQAKESFLEKAKQTAVKSNNSREFFKAIKSLNTKEPQPRWDVRKLFPGMPDREIADHCAEYFSAISQEYQPVPEPQRNGDTEWTIDMHEISSRLKFCKKPKGLVEGDIVPELVQLFPDLLAIPLHHIYNSVIRECKWPDLWKTETVKIIPKGKVPESVKDVRNISCTPLFSKVLEHFVLAKLRTMMSLSGAQFGGIKGVGIDHFLIETWHEVLMNLEDPEAAASLISIDFSKAFNRMDHSACLAALTEAGVDLHVVRVVQAFLCNRKMAVHVHGQVSAIQPAPGGAPQGSVLGSYLFCATTDRLSNPRAADPPDRSFEFEGNGVLVPDEESDESLTEPMSPIGPPGPDMWGDLTTSESEADSIDFGTRRTNQRLLDTTIGSFRASQTMIDDFHADDEWVRATPTVKAYIDDYNVIERVRAATAPCHISNGKTSYRVHAPGSQAVFKGAKDASKDIGMVVNDKKTQMLCIHPKGDQMRSFIMPENSNEVIESGTSLKILGFTFGSTPDVSQNTENVVKNFNCKLWGLQCLKGAGMKERDLLMTYKSVIRPTVEFAACSYHSLLTCEQANIIERLQGRAMKVVFGENVSYRTVIESGNIELLADRREQLVKNFAVKASKNERFANWFPPNPEIDHELRRREKYLIPRLRTERAKKSPIIYMRRILNDM